VSVRLGRQLDSAKSSPRTSIRSYTAWITLRPRLGTDAGIGPRLGEIEQRRFADGPLAEQRGVMRMALAGPRKSGHRDLGLVLATSQQRREDPAAGPKWVIGLRL